MTCNFDVVDLCLFLNKHRSTTVLEEIILDLHHHIARLAWLIQEYLFLGPGTGPTSGPILKIQ